MDTSNAAWIIGLFMLHTPLAQAQVGSAPAGDRPLQSILERSQPLKLPAPAQEPQELVLADTPPAKADGLQLEPTEHAEHAELIRQRSASGLINVERWVAEDSTGNLVNHGTYVAYDSKGTRALTGTYRWGQREGEWRKRISLEQAKQLHVTLDPGFAGPFVSRATFRDGMLHGEWTVIDAEQRPVLSWSFAAGQRNGVSKFFVSSGEVTRSLNYVNDLVDGSVELNNADQPEQFLMGKVRRLVETWYAADPANASTRQLKSQEWVLEPAVLNLASSDWDTCRVEYLKPEAIRAVRHGRSATFHRNGQMESEGNYEFGKRSGKFAWWYVNGQPKTEGEYHDDQEHNQWNWWHENGMKEATGSYIHGNKVDEWSVWKPDGKLVSRTVQSGQQVAERVDSPVR